MKSLTAVLSGCGYVALAGLLLSSCGSNRSAEASYKPPDKTKNPLAITVSETEMRQLKIGTPAWTTVTQSTHAAARIEADATRMVRVSAPVTGRITKMQVLEGQYVEIGQILATILSTDLADAEFAFVRAYSQQRLADRAVDRAKKLLKADVIGSAELLRREAELDQGTAELAAARSQLQILGVPPLAIDELASTGKIDSAANILATISGTVLDRKVTMGQIVQPAEIVFVIADLSKVWMEADIPEEVSGDVSVGKAVEAEVAAFPNSKIHGVLSFVSSVVNPQTRTVQVRMNLSNPQHKYKPDMLATMAIQNPASRQQVVPNTAIVRNGNDDSLFVRTGERNFLLTPVRLGEQVGNERVLQSGIDPGKQIVTDGAFDLNNERQRQAQVGED